MINKSKVDEGKIKKATVLRENCIHTCTKTIHHYLDIYIFEIILLLLLIEKLTDRFC